MWTCGSYSTKLSQSFKRVIETVTDGTVSQFQKIPSTPLLVNLQVNGKSIDAMIDTGSSTTIISRTLLYKLIHRPRIRFKRNTYRTASNTNLCTIGLVQLEVDIGEIPTFVLAEISTDLCTELVLGNDWITANGIDIITTQRHIRKCNGSQTATVPFYSNTKRDHIVSPIERFNRVDKANGDTSSSTMVNISESPSQSNATSAQSESACRVCFEVFPTKRCLFAHLGVSGHYAEQKVDGSLEQLPRFVYDHINQSIHHIDNPRDRKRVQSTLVKYASVFDTSKATTIQSIVKHTIEVNNSRPIVQRPYRKTEEQETAITNLCQQFLHDKIIRPSQSPWASPVVLQRKKDTSWRFCLDYRKLNDVTEKDNYPLPRIQEIFDALQGAKYFTKLDFHGGYHQIPIDERDKPKTAFVTRAGQWEFNVMPQGIKNGPPSFQRIVDKVLGKMQWHCAIAYIDDIIVYSKSIEKHHQHLEQILSRLYHANFRLNPIKCEFLKQEIQFLGHIISERGIEPCPQKTKAINEFPTPTNAKSAVSFVKMAEYYRNHIPDFSSLAQPLFQFTKKDATFVWGEQQEKSFRTIKHLLTEKPLIRFPDSNLTFVIQVDASNVGIGAVLTQDTGGGQQPIAYFSQKLNRQQSNWNTTEKECFAVVSAIRKWEHYIRGRDFVVRTDHHALCWLNRRYNSNPKLNRWRMALQDYTFVIEHVKGNANCVADCLSRFPVDPSVNDDLQQRSTSTQTEKPTPIVSVVTTRTMTHTNATTSAIETLSTPFLPSKETNRINVFTNENLQRDQQQDAGIKKILQNIHLSPFNREYSMREGLLCRNHNRSGKGVSVPVVPKSRVKDVLMAYHNSSMNGAHFGKDRTYHKIRHRYHWSGMYQDVANHVRSCPNCSVNKHSRTKPNGHLMSVDPPEGVWENLAMDFVGPITPPSSDGSRYILVITDLLSKFVISKATRDNSALTAAKVLVEEVILKYGSPNQILTDNGSHFTAEIFNAITSLCGVCHVYTTPYHPKANGTCERFNASMCDSLASICNSKRTDWDRQVSKTTFAYNTSHHVTTGYTPFELVYGRRCKLPFDLAKITTTIADPHLYLHQLKTYLRTATHIAADQIRLKQAKAKQRYDLHRAHEQFSIGDFVYVKRLGFHQKLAPKYDGPYQVIQLLNDCTFRVQNPSDLRHVFNVHANRVRRCHESQTTNGKNSQRPNNTEE